MAHVLSVSFNGTDGATTAVDASPSNHILTFVGNAQLDTAIKKFGTASLLLDGDGARVGLPATSVFAFAANEPFTMHGQVRLAASPVEAEASILSHYNPADGQRCFQFRVDLATTTPRLTVASWPNDGTGTGAALISSPTSTIIPETFHHVAWTRDEAGRWYLFIDGVLQGTLLSAASQAAFWTTSLVTPAIGTRHATGATGDFTGHIDQVEVIKGTALWTSNFTPPTNAQIGRISKANLYVHAIGGRDAQLTRATARTSITQATPPAGITKAAIRALAAQASPDVATHFNKTTMRILCSMKERGRPIINVRKQAWPPPASL